MLKKPDIDHYSIAELLEALESIDEQKHPQRAQELVDLLVIKKFATSENLLRTYENERSSILADTILFPFLQDRTNVYDKITRIIKHAG